MKKKEIKVNVSYYFEKIKNIVYKFTRIGDGEWYVCWSDKKLHKNGGEK